MGQRFTNPEPSREDSRIFHTLFGGPPNDVVSLVPSPEVIIRHAMDNLPMNVPEKKVLFKDQELHLLRDSITLDSDQMKVSFALIGEVTKINKVDKVKWEREEGFMIPISNDDLEKGSINVVLENSRMKETTEIQFDSESQTIKGIRQYLDFQKTKFLLEEVYDEEECVICLEGACDTILLPCRHKAMCFNCAKILTTETKVCPICRDNIKTICRM